VLASVAFEDSPVIVEADSALGDRKLWELGHYARSGRAGPDVDRELCGELRFPDEPPPHPVEAIDLDDVEPMTHRELDKEPRLLAPFFYSALWEELSNEIDAVTNSPLVLSETTEAQRVREVQEKVVAKWLEQWDHVALTEILLDTALFRALAGHRSAARLFRDVAVGPAGEERLARLTHFLEQLVFHLFDENVSEPDASGDIGSGGIIIP